MVSGLKPHRCAIALHMHIKVSRALIIENGGCPSITRKLCHNANHVADNRSEWEIVRLYFGFTCN